MKRKNEFSKEKDILKGLDQAEAVVKRVENKVCNWQDAQDISILRADNRLVERKKVLDKTVPTRVCPSCRNRIWIDSSWVVEDNKAWCRSCFHSRRNKGDEDLEIVGSFVGDPVVKFNIVGWNIRILRERADVGAAAFAKRMGWTTSYQEQIERNVYKTLSLEVIERMINVFESIGVSIIDKT